MRVPAGGPPARRRPARRGENGRGTVLIDAASSPDGALAIRSSGGRTLLGHFPAGRIVEVRSAGAASVHAMLVEYDRDHPVSGDWYSDDCHFFDMSTSVRPVGARGYFGEAFRTLRPVGRVFFAPAGHPYHGEGGQGRQRSLGLFIQAQHRSDCDGDFGAGVVPVLHNCLRLESDVVRDLLVRIAREVAEPGFASSLLLEGLSLTLLVETARLLDAARSDGSHRGGIAPWRLKAIEARVRDSDVAPSLAELAELCQLSRRQLVRAYRVSTGRTIGALVQTVMTERAVALLERPELPVAEVAARLNYGSTAAFSTAFRKSFGQSPRAFRAARRIGSIARDGQGPDTDDQME